jgi:hypothetical protein
MRDRNLFRYSPRRLPLVFLSALLLGCATLIITAAPAFAEEAVPRWTVTSVSLPTNFAPDDESGQDMYRILVTNTGGAESDGPVTITDTLPEGLTLDHAGAKGFELASPHGTEGIPGHAQEGAPLRCTGLTCEFSGRVIPDETLVLTVPVDVGLKVPATVVNVVRVSGGGAPDASVSTPTTISATEAGFGIATGSATTSLSNTQAGAHADLTATIGFNTLNDGGKVAGSSKETVVDLPPGFAGDLIDTPTCPVAVFGREECPIETQVGITTVTESAEAGKYKALFVVPVYNLTPEPGSVAKLGFITGGFRVQGDVTVRPGSYELQTRFQNIVASDLAEFDSVSLTVWGVPTAHIHDAWRWNPELGSGEASGKFGVSSSNPLVPYLSNPTSCTNESVHATISVRSWAAPEGHPSEALTPLGPFGGCDRLRLPATFVAQPTTQEAYAPTGLNAELGVAQTYDNAEGLSSAHLNKAVVTLPEGMTVNPSAGAGLVGCTEEEYAHETLETPAGEGCPNESKLGSVKITAPAIKEEAFGSVFLATPYENPFGEPGPDPNGSLLALYVVARIPNRGVIVKSAGKVEVNPVTGRLTTTFEDLPQLPFTTFTLSFRQGETSPLVSPPACGSFVASAELTPWSNLSEVLLAASPPFEITHGFGGGACSAGGVPPFSPEAVAGTLDDDAGAYSPLDVRIVRNDGEQEITGFSSQLPPGLTANLSGVPFCSEAEIQQAREKTGQEEEVDPACPAASQIGRTLVGAGVGQVLAYAPGKVFMAGPFEGAPFSIAAITSADVGPFDLGTVVVHLPLFINPVTTAVSIPAGPADQIPHIIDGIVVHVRDIRVYIERPDFTLNPTSCNPMTFSATVIGGGADPTDPAGYDPVTITDPFQAANCASLAFKPVFKVSTSGKTSRVDGASLSVKLTYPKAPQGSQANIRSVKVELPKQLPSRLPTLQKACVAATFEANPASCPAASAVGHATATTPILPVPLTGPAYFVSHGGAKWPELIIVLQGYGVTLDLHGETLISKAGVTSSTFATVPDDPIGSFELTLPQGSFSALTTDGSLCKVTRTVGVKKRITVKVGSRRRTITREVEEHVSGSLTMPTTFIGQNGAVLHQNTPVSVTGCAKAAKPAKKAKKMRKGGKKPKKK